MEPCCLELYLVFFFPPSPSYTLRCFLGLLHVAEYSSVRLWFGLDFADGRGGGLSRDSGGGDGHIVNFGGLFR